MIVSRGQYYVKPFSTWQYFGPPLQEGGVQWDVFCLGGRFTPCVHTCPGVGLVCQWVPFTPGLHTCRPMERGDTSPPGRATTPANSGLSHLANALSAHLRALRIAPRIISQAQKISRLILRSLYLWLLYHCVKFQLQLAEVILTLELQLERKHKLVQNSYQVV